MEVFRILFCALLITAVTCVTSPSAQRKDFNMYDAGGIPRSLQSSLIKPLNAFVEARREGHRDKLSETLGPFSECSSRREYTSAEKEWVIQELKEKPLMNLTPERVTFTTAILNRPFRNRWWYIEGEGEFPDSEKGKVVIAAYRNNMNGTFNPW